MLWIILIVGAIGTMVSFLAIVIDREQYYSRFGKYAIGICISFVIGMVGLLGLSVVWHMSYEEILQTEYWEIKALSNNRYVYVSTDTDAVYSFFYQVNDDGIKRGKVDADKTIIYERDDCVPHVVEYTIYTKNKMNNVLRIILAFGFGENINKNYEIYIPRGTVLSVEDSQ